MFSYVQRSSRTRKWVAAAASLILFASGGFAYAETDAEAQHPEAIKAMRADWAKLRNLLEVVTNNTETNVAGGGTRYQPALPAVVAQ